MESQTPNDLESAARTKWIATLAALVAIILISEITYVNVVNAGRDRDMERACVQNGGTYISVTKDCLLPREPK